MMKSAVAEYHRQQLQAMMAGAGHLTQSGVGLLCSAHQEDPGGAADGDAAANLKPEPVDLFIELGMLILEGRKPENSLKGRVEGEHCPTRYPGGNMHVCAPEKIVRCKHIESTKDFIRFLSRSDIPMSVEVLLYPDCCHSSQTSIEIGTSAETMQPSDQPTQYLLLEQWIVQLVPKRFQDGHSQSHLLFQAVRSFLHFSQISAWLSSTRGRLPQNIVYRVCAPGESFSTSFANTPEEHTFPILNLSKSSSLHVTVASLPRPLNIPVLPCSKPEHTLRDRSRRDVGSGGGDDDREFQYAHVDPSRERDQRSGEELKKERRQQHDQQRRRQLSGDAASGGGDQDGDCGKHRKTSCTQMLKVLLPDAKDVASVGHSGHSSPRLRDGSPQHLRNNRFPLKQWPCESFPSGRPTSAECDDVSSCRLKHRHHTYHQQRDEPLGKRTPTTYELYYTSGQPSFSPVELERRIHELKLATLDRTSSGSSESVATVSTPPPSRGESTPRPICAWRDRPPSLDDDDGIFFTARSSLEDRGLLVHEAHRRMSSRKDDEDPPATEFGTPLSTVPWLSYHKPLDESQAENVYVENRPKHSFSGSCSPGTPPPCGLIRSRNSPSHQPAAEIQQQRPPSAISTPPSGGVLSDSPSRSVQGSYNIVEGYQSVHQASSPKLPGSCRNSSGNTPSPTSSPMLSKRRGFSLDGHEFQADIAAPFRKPMQYEGTGESPGTPGSIPFSPVFGKSMSLFRSVLGKDNPSWGKENLSTDSLETCTPSPLSGLRSDVMRRSLDRSNTYIFNPSTGLPINSSPAPLRKAKTEHDCASLLKPRSLLKSSPSCNDLENSNNSPLSPTTRVFSTSAPASTSCLLGNFEESVLNGRLEPLGTINGFTAEIGASGAFCPKHVVLPVTTFFYSVSDDDAPSSYFGYINLEHVGRRGYRIPQLGTIQVTLFNPNKTVVKMFVMRYNLSDMPPNCQTFARQRIFYMPSNAQLNDDCEKELRYLIHIRFQSSRSGKIYLHTDLRMIFARHSPDLESSLGTYELRSFTETPTNPQFSPKK